MTIKPRFIFALTLLLGTFQSQASIAIPGSRVVYEEARGWERMALQQVGKTPGVVQVWLDQGDANAAIDPAGALFELMPVVSRIDPGRRQIVHIERIGEHLPQDRESLLWLNVLEIPLVPGQGGNAQPVYQPAAEGFRARVKFFYRPKGLSSSPALAHQSLRFSLGHTLADGRIEVRVINPTPYHITFMDVALRDTPNAAPLAEFDAKRPEARMVAPMAELVLTLDPTAALGKSASSLMGAAVTFNIINDSGGQTRGQQALDMDVAVR